MNSAAMVSGRLADFPLCWLNQGGGIMDEVAAKPGWWRRRNWWKIGFFVMLFAFEVTREIAAVAINPPPKVATAAFMSATNTFTRASGRWVRIDGGGALMPGATVIECRELESRCIEATARMIDGFVGEPIVDDFEAKFTPEAITYENDTPGCVRYSVTLDFKLKKVFAVRERKQGVDLPGCSIVEDRMEMTLGDGYQKGEDPMGDNFVPIIRGTVAVAQLVFGK